jgi:hypothetical protein
VAVSEKAVTINISSSISISGGGSLLLLVQPILSNMRVSSVDGSVGAGRIWTIEWLPSRDFGGVSVEIEAALWYRSADSSSSSSSSSSRRLGSVNVTLHVLACVTSVKEGEPHPPAVLSRVTHPSLRRHPALPVPPLRPAAPRACSTRASSHSQQTAASPLLL